MERESQINDLSTGLTYVHKLGTQIDEKNTQSQTEYFLIQIFVTMETKAKTASLESDRNWKTETKPKEFYSNFSSFLNQIHLVGQNFKFVVD